MASDLACVACMIDPASTSMVVPMAQATLIAVPFFLRGRIAAAARRAIRRGDDAADEVPSDEGCDTRADDRADGAEPPGALRP